MIIILVSILFLVSVDYGRGSTENRNTNSTSDNDSENHSDNKDPPKRDMNFQDSSYIDIVTFPTNRNVTNSDYTTISELFSNFEQTSDIPNISNERPYKYTRNNNKNASENVEEIFPETVKSSSFDEKDLKIPITTLSYSIHSNCNKTTYDVSKTINCQNTEFTIDTYVKQNPTTTKPNHIITVKNVEITFKDTSTTPTETVLWTKTENRQTKVSLSRRRYLNNKIEKKMKIESLKKRKPKKFKINRDQTSEEENYNGSYQDQFKSIEVNKERILEKHIDVRHYPKKKKNKSYLYKDLYTGTIHNDCNHYKDKKTKKTLGKLANNTCNSQNLSYYKQRESPVKHTKTRCTAEYKHKNFDSRESSRQVIEENNGKFNKIGKKYVYKRMKRKDNSHQNQSIDTTQKRRRESLRESSEESDKDIHSRYNKQKSKHSEKINSRHMKKQKRKCSRHAFEYDDSYHHRSSSSAVRYRGSRHKRNEKKDNISKYSNYKDEKIKCTTKYTLYNKIKNKTIEGYKRNERKDNISTYSNYKDVKIKNTTKYDLDNKIKNKTIERHKRNERKDNISKYSNYKDVKIKSTTKYTLDNKIKNKTKQLENAKQAKGYEKKKFKRSKDLSSMLDESYHNLHSNSLNESSEEKSVKGNNFDKYLISDEILQRFISSENSDNNNHECINDKPKPKETQKNKVKNVEVHKDIQEKPNSKKSKSRKKQTFEESDESYDFKERHQKNKSSQKNDSKNKNDNKLKHTRHDLKKNTDEDESKESNSKEYQYKNKAARRLDKQFKQQTTTTTSTTTTTKTTTTTQKKKKKCKTNTIKNNIKQRKKSRKITYKKRTHASVSMSSADVSTEERSDESSYKRTRCKAQTKINNKKERPGGCRKEKAAHPRSRNKPSKRRASENENLLDISDIFMDSLEDFSEEKGDGVVDDVVVSFVLFAHGHIIPNLTLIRSYAPMFQNYPPDAPSLRITNVGKNQSYEAGLYLRNRYKKLLSSNYEPKEIEVRCIDTDYAKASTLVAMSALYPPLQNESNRAAALRLQPVPYDSERMEEDDLRFYENCPSYLALRQNVLNDTAVKKKLEPFQSSQLPGINFFTGRKYNITHLYDFYYLGKLLRFLYPYGSYPIDHASYCTAIQELSRMTFWTSLLNSNLIRFASGVMMNEIMDAIDLVHDHVPTLKMYLATGTDLNVAALMTASKVFALHQPENGAIFCLEIFRVTVNGLDDFGIRAIYKPDPEVKTKILKIKGCKYKNGYCSTREFQRLCGKYAMTVEEYKNKCQIQQRPITRPPVSTTTIIPIR